MSESDRSTNRFCQICGRQAPAVELVMAHSVRPVIVDMVKQSYPEWSDAGFICVDDLNRYRYEYVRSLVETEKGELLGIEKEVVESIARNEILSTLVDKDFDSKLTVGQRLSDRIAQFGGSWTFLLIFACILGVWVAVNSAAIVLK